MAGEPVHRTKDTHPYAYHSFVVYRALPNEALTAGTYSDRLRQNDWSKAEALTLKHFSDTSHYWDGREPARIEALLRDFTEQPSLELGVVLGGCNVSSGYPYWYFGWRDATETEPSEDRGANQPETSSPAKDTP